MITWRDIVIDNKRKNLITENKRVNNILILKSNENLSV